MPTEAKSALVSGLALLFTQLAQTFTFGSTEFEALVSPPMPTAAIPSPRGGAQGPDHDLEITADVAAFGGTIPRAGQHLVHDSKKYLVQSVRFTPGAHIITFLCRQPT